MATSAIFLEHFATVRRNATSDCLAIIVSQLTRSGVRGGHNFSTRWRTDSDLSAASRARNSPESRRAKYFRSPLPRALVPSTRAVKPGPRESSREDQAGNCSTHSTSFRARVHCDFSRVRRWRFPEVVRVAETIERSWVLQTSRVVSRQSAGPTGATEAPMFRSWPRRWRMKTLWLQSRASEGDSALPDKSASALKRHAVVCAEFVGVSAMTIRSIFSAGAFAVTNSGKALNRALRASAPLGQ